jgi:hypothetical protein
MQIYCNCGSKMNIYFSTLSFRQKWKIENVPIWYCNCCGKSEMIPYFKEEFLSYILQLEHTYSTRNYSYNDWSEHTNLMMKFIDKEFSIESLQVLIAKRIDELLDEWLIATESKDDIRLKEIHRRLLQMSKNSNLYDVMS